MIAEVVDVFCEILEETYPPIEALAARPMRSD